MRVASFLLNGAEVWLLFLACLELNCVFAALNPKMTSNREETKHLLDVVQPLVLVVQDEDIADKVESCAPELMKKCFVKLISTGGQEFSSSWQSFSDFVEDKVDTDALGSLEISRKAEDVILVFFTSGTTSLPKGCPHTNITFGTALRGWTSWMGFDDTRSLCNHMPIFHSFGFFQSFMYHFAGVKAVHPSSSFDPESSWKAVQLERCSDVGAVPAVLQAVRTHPEFKKTDTSCLKLFLLGATAIPPDLIRVCTEELGSLKASTGFGMSEAGAVMIHKYGEIPARTPEKITAGRVVPGVKARVCDPETREVVDLGCPGELHVGGLGIIEKYWLSTAQDPKANGVFYSDDYGNWMATGDQVVMHENGEIEVVGRYKDMIIRGGVNISPAAIESMLSSRFGITAEVIGIPDEIAGEVPIAIFKKGLEEFDLLEIRKTLILELGKGSAVEEIIYLESLGLEDFPRTPSGKVQKFKLREIVRNSPYIHKQVMPGAEVTEILLHVWSKVLGLSPGDLTPRTSVLDWADSLILARFIAALRKESGLAITMKELLENSTVQGQAKLLNSRRPLLPSSTNTQALPERHDPPRIEDIIVAHGEQERFQNIKSKCIETIVSLGLGWNDVEDIIPAVGIQDLHLKKRRPQSCNHRHAFMCPGSSTSDVQVALRDALAHHPILRSMAFYPDDQTTVHVVIRPSEQWFSKTITNVGSINTSQDLGSLKFSDGSDEFVAFPGPLIRFLITHVRDQDCAAIVYVAQHSIFDANSFSLLLEDLDKLLVDNKPIPTSHIQFKAWADHYYSLQESIPARQAIEWNRKRLAGIFSRPSTLFPLQKAPEWFMGDSNGWIDNSTGEIRCARKSLDVNPSGFTGISEQGLLPDAMLLKSTHSIDTSQVVKAALAVVNIRHTKESQALFAQVQAGRTWPFLPDWQANLMPQVLDVNGPCIEWILNRIDVVPGDTVLQFLKVLQEEQALLTKYANAPKKALISALNEGETRDGDMMVEAFRRQFFNWLPSSTAAMKFRKLELVQYLSWDDMGLLWNCFMPNRETLQINVTWDDAQLRRVEVEGLLEELFAVVTKLATKENWGKKLSEVI